VKYATAKPSSLELLPGEMHALSRLVKQKQKPEIMKRH